MTTNQQAEFTVSKSFKTDTRSPFRWVLSHALRHGFFIFMMTGGAIGNAALAAAIPVYLGQAFNAINQSHVDIGILKYVTMMIVISQVIRGILQLGRNFGAEILAQRLERDIRYELYVRLLGKSMTFHSLQPIGDTMARATNDVREVNFMFNPGLNLVLGSGIFLIMPLVIAPRYHPSLILVPSIFIICYILALWQYLHELRPISERIRDFFGRLNSHLAETIDGIETVKGTSQEPREINRFEKFAQTFKNNFIQQGDVEARFLPLLLLAFSDGLGLLHALFLYRNGALDLGQVIAYFSLLQLFGFPTFVSLFSYSQVSLGMAAARRILDLINRETELDQNIGGITNRINGEIEFKNVGFAYAGSDSTLTDLNFKIQPGSTIAIVGQTGSGKTSLIKLLNRTYDATKGQVLIDGVDVRNWELETLRKNISIIEQDIFLFSRSIQENIAFGKPDATEEEIHTAAKLAQADSFIRQMNDGYKTVIGERGVTLSGGQRQRLALARAFLTNPPILILDDSTSAIDSSTEDEIQKAIFTAAKGRTTLIITHRLSQIRWADVIIHLRNGKIEAVGTHDELIKSSIPYQRIFSEA